MNSEQVCAEWKDIEIKQGQFIRNEREYEEWYSESSDKNKEKRYVKILVKDSFVYVTTHLVGEDCDEIMNKVNQQNWDINIEKVE